MKRIGGQAVTWLVVLLLTIAASPTKDEQTGVVSDTATLQSTIVMKIGSNIFRSMEVGSGSHPFFRSILPRGAVEEHRRFLRILQQQGVEVLDVAGLLDSAIREARRQGALTEWIRTTFPATADRILERIDEVDADSVLNRRKEHFYVREPDGGIQPLFPGISSMYWSRDFAVSTPRGIIIGNGRHYNRKIENSIARLIFRFAPEVKRFPIVFDAARENVLLDGGDTIVLDEKTLLLGVGNRSSREAAALLARKLNMDVLAVNMPPGPQSGVHRLLLHLDTICNLVDRKTVLAVPYFLEKEWVDRNPLKPILTGLAAQVRKMQETDEKTNFGDPEALEKTITQAREIGWVTRYQAGTGEPVKLGEKLVDYFRRSGYRIVYVGGIRPGEGDIEPFLEKALYELRWQGANVVQLGPGKVIAFEHNVLTNQALRDAGIEVITFPGGLLSIRGGGPHCLLMPLVRFDEHRGAGDSK